MEKGAHPAGSGRWSLRPTPGPLTAALVKAALVPRVGTHRGELDTTLKMRITLGARDRQILLSLAGFRLESDEDWDPDLRARVNTTARERRGRVLFCLEEDPRRTMAAIAFSLKAGSQRPLLAYAIVTRREPELRDQSLALALLSKRCLHFIGLALGRPASLYHDVPRGKESFAKSLGFTLAKRESDLDIGGTLMTQPPPTE